MPKAKDDLLLEWERLLKAVRETERELGCVAPYAEALSNAHAQSVAYKSLRDTRRAATEEANQHLSKSVQEGQEAAARLRAFVRSRLGYQNEKLRRYGMKPYPGSGGKPRAARGGGGRAAA